MTTFSISNSTQFTESYSYDSLDRLIQVTNTNTAVSPKTLTYDVLGNILTKSDVGTYTYAINSSSMNTHALSSINFAAGGSTSYSDDADGEPLYGNGRTNIWSSFGKVLSVTLGANTVTYAYDPEHERVAQWTPTVDTVYLDGFNVMYAPGTTTNGQAATFVLTPSGKQVAEIDRSGMSASSIGTAAVSFYLTDWQNSVSSVTDNAGDLLENDSYDAWGKRRNMNGVDNTPTGTIESVTIHGYINQEEVYDDQLVDLNARMYDPWIGRVLNVDPIIKSNVDLQAYNGYSYARNNPVVLSDPSGDTYVGCELNIYYGGTLAPVVSSAAGNPDLPGGGYYEDCSNNQCDFDTPSTPTGGGGGAAVKIQTITVTAKRKPKITHSQPMNLDMQAVDPAAVVMSTGYDSSDRCVARSSPPRSGGGNFEVNAAQVNSIAAAKFIQHSWPLNPLSGNSQSTFGGVMTNPSAVADGAMQLLYTHDALPAGAGNLRITGDLGYPVGNDFSSPLDSTNYLTVILGPPSGKTESGLPIRPVYSIYPGC